ncbi:MAG TPA: autotransporter domain-containing protein [Pseudolabrys sp.]|nr:autotransporter domain-containing protein [Pseudolabrys sp.]
MFAGSALTALALIAPAIARADDFQGLGFLPGGSLSIPNGVSADGSVVVGYGNGPASNEAFLWNGTLTGLGFLPGGNVSRATGVSANGSVVVGFSNGTAAPNGVAFIWSGGTMTRLGFLTGGGASEATGVSADGSVVVGWSTDAGANTEAFRWSAGTMTGLGFLTGGTYSIAYGVSADGSVVVGASAPTFGNSEAFRWSAGTMTGLGFLPGGASSTATGVSSDGSVVVGYGSTAASSAEAFRWVNGGGGMSGLGFLPGGSTSYANAVSANGLVVVGYGDSTAAGPGNVEAFRWTQSTGMESIKGLLSASGVNMTGWSLFRATGVSADGSVIVGDGSGPSNNDEAWLARFSTQFGNGLITPGVVAQSFAGQSALGQTGNAAIDNALGTFSEFATQAHASQDGRNTPYSVFAYGGYDSDPAASGTFGVTMDLPNALIAGAAVSANYVETDMVYDGSAKMTGGSAGAFVARVPDAGLQWLVGVNGLTLKGDIDRGYLNGSSLASSSGNTSANGYGLTGRAGWTFDRLLPKTQVTPFVSYTYSTIHFNGYTETTGVFPAQFDGFTANAQTSRLGADARYTFARDTWLWGTLAWAHRLDGGQGADISGTLIGLFGMNVPGASVAQDWAEATAGIRLPAWKNGAITASLTASIPADYATTYVARLGVTQAF